MAGSHTSVAQGTQVIFDGSIRDSSGAAIPHVTLVITPEDARVAAVKVTTDASGRFSQPLSAGTYEVVATCPGFAPLDYTLVMANKPSHLDGILRVATRLESVNVSADASASLGNADNKSALVFSGDRLDMLSDDDDTFRQEVLAVAGGVGTGGAQIYIDGFNSERFPPKNTIREISINENPFSAEYQGLGGSRIQISTKPGTNKLHGSISVSGNFEALNSLNPYVTSEPPYYSVRSRGDLSGALGKRTSFFTSGNYEKLQANSIVNALNPDGTPLSEAVSAPQTHSTLSIRLERQLSANDFFLSRFEYDRQSTINAGVGLLVLPSEGTNNSTTTQTLQLGNTKTIGSKLVLETRFQYERVAFTSSPVSTTPTVIVQGSFAGGGAPGGAVQDDRNHFDFQQYASLSRSSHFVRAGLHLRWYQDNVLSAANYNGQYTFPDLASYAAGQPSLFSITTGKQTVALSTNDLSVFAEDEWKLHPNLTLTYGVRLETQTDIPDRFNIAPRAGLAWGINKQKGLRLLTLRANVGDFHDRFDESNLLTAARQNGISQQTFYVNNPSFYPTIPSSAQLFGDSPTVYSVSPHLRVATEYIGILAVERDFGRVGSVSANYLIDRGVHQYNSLNVNAPLPDADNTSNQTGIGVRPLGGSQNIYQFASAGTERAQAFFINGSLRLNSFLSLVTLYSVRRQMADTFGSTSFPSQPYNVSADYGPSGLGSQAIAQHFTLTASLKLPLKLTSRFFLSSQSSQRFNITTGTDRNGDTIYNDRPAFATNPGPSSAIYKTIYGTFDANPQPGETIIPYNFAQGPRLIFTELSARRDFRFGHGSSRRSETKTSVNQEVKQKAPPPYDLSFSVYATNLLNHVNAGLPVAILSSPYFGRSISLNPAFAPTASANRVIYLQTAFRF